MVKIKINIKSNTVQQKTTSPAEKNKVNILTVSQLKQAADYINKVIPYDEDFSDDDIPNEIPEKPQQKIIIKPKITVGSKIKINIKKEDIDDYGSDDSDDEDIELPSIEPIIVLKQPTPTPQTMVKINVKKKSDVATEYKSLILSQKPIKTSPLEPIVLPTDLQLESFYDDGNEYFINWSTGFIFPPETSQATEQPPDPIGKLIETAWDSSDFNEDKYPLMKRKINWFFHYELDVDSIN